MLFVASLYLVSGEPSTHPPTKDGVGVQTANVEKYESKKVGNCSLRCNLWPLHTFFWEMHGTLWIPHWSHEVVVMITKSCL